MVRKLFCVFLAELLLAPVNAGQVTLANGGKGLAGVQAGGTGMVLIQALGAVVGAAAPTVLQSSCTIGNGLTSISVTLPNLVTAGDSIGGIGADNGCGLNSTDFSDNKSNKYVLYGNTGSGSAQVGVYASTNVPTGGSNFKVTFAPSTTGCNQNMCAVEMSVVKSSDVAVSNSGLTVGGGTAFSGNFSPNANNEICLGGLTHTSATTNLFATQTLLGVDTNNSTDEAYIASWGLYQIGTSSMSWSATGSINYFAAATCFY